MSKKELIQFVIDNLGKEIRNQLNNNYCGMIIGYDSIMNSNFIIVSRVDDKGWHELEEHDIILLNSPLNVSYWYILINNVEFIQ